MSINQNVGVAIRPGNPPDPAPLEPCAKCGGGLGDRRYFTDVGGVHREYCSMACAKSLRAPRSVEDHARNCRDLARVLAESLVTASATGTHTGHPADTELGELAVAAGQIELACARLAASR